MSEDMSDDDKTDDKTDVRIGLPLPMDITGTLLNIIGLTWPGTVVKTGEGPSYDRHMVLGIPNSQRHKSAKAAEKYTKRKQFLNADTESDLTNLDPSGVSFTWPEYLAKTWVNLARECWEKFPDAKNYLESTVLDRETKQEYVFYVARSKGQTPHALRDAAEKRLQAVRDICEKRAMDDWLRDELMAAVGEEKDA